MARGSIAAAVLGLSLALCCAATVVHGKEWIVGGDKGWNPGISGWDHDDLNITAGDVLVFNYNPSSHDVVEVDEVAYFKSCKPGDGAKTYDSGNDRVTLSGGRTFFICSIQGHCERGMKIAITAKES